jgi:hypothetical protein
MEEQSKAVRLFIATIVVFFNKIEQLKVAAARQQKQKRRRGGS